MLRASLFLASAILLLTATAKPATIAETMRNAKVGETVELQGTVTFCGRWYVIVNDRTGGVTIYDTFREHFARTGDVIRVSAKVENHHGEIVGRITAHEKVGENPSLAQPVVIPAEAFHSTTGLEARAVTATGTVVDAFRDEVDPEWAYLVFAPQTAPVLVTVFDPHNTLDFSVLIGAMARVTGTVSTEGHSRPYLGRHLLTFSASDVAVSKSAPSDPFAAEQMLYDANATAYPVHADGRRYRVTGTVLATWDSRSFFLQPDRGPAIRVRIGPGRALPPVGSCITVSGFPTHTIFFAKLGNAVWRPAPDVPAVRTSDPVDATARDLLLGKSNQPKLNYRMDGRLMRIRGRLVSVSGVGTPRCTLFLDCGTDTVTAEAPDIPLPSIGAELELTGVCRFTEDEGHGSSGIARLTGFTVLLRSAEDLKVLRNPPWWTPFRAVVALSVLLFLFVGGITWNFVLQKLVSRKGRALARESLARLKAELRTGERMALAVELHDTIAQNLTGVSMQLEGVGEAHRIGSPRLGELIAKARHALDSCCVELRSCLWDLRNDAFDSVDISATVRKAIAPHLGGATADVALDLPRSHISDSTFHALLCILRELVINAVKHGHAAHIDIHGEMTAEGLRISVGDNGRGFDPANRPGPDQGHFGLLGIQERLDRIGGTLDIASSPGHGAIFSIIIES